MRKRANKHSKYKGFSFKEAAKLLRPELLEILIDKDDKQQRINFQPELLNKLPNRQSEKSTLWHE